MGTTLRAIGRAKSYMRVILPHSPAPSRGRDSAFSGRTERVSWCPCPNQPHRCVSCSSQESGERPTQRRVDSSSPTPTSGAMSDSIPMKHPPSTATSCSPSMRRGSPVSYTHLRAHETVLDLVCRLLLEKKKKKKTKKKQQISTQKKK